ADPAPAGLRRPTATGANASCVIIIGLLQGKLVAVAGQRAERVVVTVTAYAQLLEVAGAVRPVGRFAHFLHGRQQQSDQHREDGNDDQQFNERERRPATDRTTPHGRTPWVGQGEGASPTIAEGCRLSTERPTFSNPRQSSRAPTLATGCLRSGAAAA